MGCFCDPDSLSGILDSLKEQLSLAASITSITTHELVLDCLTQHTYKVSKNKAYSKSDCPILKRISSALFRSLKLDNIPGRFNQDDLILTTTLFCDPRTRPLVDPLYSNRSRYILIEYQGLYHRIRIDCSLKHRRWVPSYKDIWKAAHSGATKSSDDPNQRCKIILRQSYSKIREMRRNQEIQKFPNTPWANRRKLNPQTLLDHYKKLYSQLTRRIDPQSNLNIFYANIPSGINSDKFKLIQGLLKSNNTHWDILAIGEARPRPLTLYSWAKHNILLSAEPNGTEGVALIVNGSINIECSITDTQNMVIIGASKHGCRFIFTYIYVSNKLKKEKSSTL